MHLNGSSCSSITVAILAPLIVAQSRVILEKDRPIQVYQCPDIEVAEGVEEDEEVPVGVEGRVDTEDQGHDHDQEHADGEKEEAAGSWRQLEEKVEVADEAHSEEDQVDQEKDRHNDNEREESLRAFGFEASR